MKRRHTHKKKKDMGNKPRETWFGYPHSLKKVW